MTSKRGSSVNRIHLVPATTSGFSHLGGLPSVPAGFEWPLWEGKPQSFLLQIDLATLPAGVGTEALPRSGVLLFFYDSEQGGCGFDIKDRGNWRVYFFESTTGLTEMPAPKGLSEHALFNPVVLQPTPIQTYPGWQDARVQALQLKDGENDAYFELHASPFGKSPTHQLLGYRRMAEAIQACTSTRYGPRVLVPRDASTGFRSLGASP